MKIAMKVDPLKVTVFLALLSLVGVAFAQVPQNGGNGTSSITQSPGAQGSGWNDKILAALGSTPAQVKASAGLLGPTHCDNGNAGTVYVEYFNTATPTLGTTAPIWFVPIPTGGGGEMMPIGINGFTSVIYAVAVTAYNGATTVATTLNCAVAFN